MIIFAEAEFNANWSQHSNHIAWPNKWTSDSDPPQPYLMRHEIVFSNQASVLATSEATQTNLHAECKQLVSNPPCCSQAMIYYKQFYRQMLYTIHQGMGFWKSFWFIKSEAPAQLNYFNSFKYKHGNNMVEQRTAKWAFAKHFLAQNVEEGLGFKQFSAFKFKYSSDGIATACNIWSR